MIAPHLVQQVYRHAEAAAPVECCGYLDGQMCHPCENVWTPPDGGIRGSLGFEFSATDTVRLYESVDRCGSESVLIYHSHVDSSPSWSAADEQQARWQGKVVLTEVRRLIVAVSSGQAVAALLFEYRGGAFQCVAEFDALGQRVGEDASRSVLGNSGRGIA